jgi:hypothetical protein
MRISKFLLVAVAVAASVSVFSCARPEDPTVEIQVEPIAFGASFFSEEAPDAQNRTVLGDNGLSVLWEKNDKIAVSGGSAAFVIDPEIDEPTASVTFKGEAQVADVYYGAYPFSALQSWNGNIATMNLMEMQPARTGSFASDLNISVSKTDAAARVFQFHNVLGYLNFTIGEGSGEILEFKVSTIGGEKLSGKFTVDCGSAAPVLTAASDANTYAAISSATPLAHGNYYVALFPGTYRSGLKFTIKGTKGTAEKVIAQELILDRGKINTMGTIKWNISADFGDDFTGEDNFGDGDGDMEGFGPEDSFEFN